MFAKNMFAHADFSKQHNAHTKNKGKCMKIELFIGKLGGDSTNK